MASSEVQDLAHFICRCLARTWLGTNWKESGLSSIVFPQTKKTAQILLSNEIAGDTNRSASHNDYASTNGIASSTLGRTWGDYYHSSVYIREIMHSGTWPPTILYVLNFFYRRYTNTQTGGICTMALGTGTG